MPESFFKPVGTVKGFQRDKNGLFLPDTYFEGENAITTDLKAYLPYKAGTDTVNQAIDNRFTSGAALSSGDNGYDGIAYGTGLTALSYKLDTDINAGGDNATAYIEFSGNIAGPLTMLGYLLLGFNYVHGSTAFTKTYAAYLISQTIDSGNTFYFYWRITLT